MPKKEIKGKHKAQVTLTVLKREKTAVPRVGCHKFSQANKKGKTVTLSTFELEVKLSLELLKAICN